MKQINDEADDDKEQSEEWQSDVDQLDDVRSHVWIVKSFCRRPLLHCLQLCQLTTQTDIFDRNSSNYATSIKAYCWYITFHLVVCCQYLVSVHVSVLIALL